MSRLEQRLFLSTLFPGGLFFILPSQDDDLAYSGNQETDSHKKEQPFFRQDRQDDQNWYHTQYPFFLF